MPSWHRSFSELDAEYSAPWAYGSRLVVKSSSLFVLPSGEVDQKVWSAGVTESQKVRWQIMEVGIKKI